MHLRLPASPKSDGWQVKRDRQYKRDRRYKSCVLAGVERDGRGCRDGCLQLWRETMCCRDHVLLWRETMCCRVRRTIACSRAYNTGTSCCRAHTTHKIGGRQKMCGRVGTHDECTHDECKTSHTMRERRHTMSHAAVLCPTTCVLPLLHYPA